MCYEDKVAYRHVRYNHVCNSHTVQGLGLWITDLVKDFGLVTENKKSSLIPVESINEFHADTKRISSDTNGENSSISVKLPREFYEGRNKPALTADSQKLLFWILARNEFFNKVIEQKGIQSAYEILTSYRGTQLKKVIGTENITTEITKDTDYDKLIRKLKKVVEQLEDYKTKLK